MKDNIEKFLAIKEEVLDNLAAIEMILIDCKEKGLSDPDELLYNEIQMLSDTTREVNTSEELENVIFNGKNMEKKFDVWLSEKGLDTKELTWPEIPSSL